MDSLRKIFHDGDTDGSGELDLDELHALVCKHQALNQKVGHIWYHFVILLNPSMVASILISYPW